MVPGCQHTADSENNNNLTIHALQLHTTQPNTDIRCKQHKQQQTGFHGTQHSDQCQMQSVYSFTVHRLNRNRCNDSVCVPRQITADLGLCKALISAGFSIRASFLKCQSTMPQCTIPVDCVKPQINRSAFCNRSSAGSHVLISSANSPSINLNDNIQAVQGGSQRCYDKLSQSCIQAVVSGKTQRA